MDGKCVITKLPHHIQQKLCHTRPPYRQGKRLTSVKVYTVNDESQHIMVCGVPKLQLGEEVKKLVEVYGNIKKICVVSDYPTEEFTEAYYIHYVRIQSARIAKRFLDGKNFYGGSLHVFYAPELETLAETRTKLFQRQRDIAIRIKRNQQEMLNPNTDKFIPKVQYHRRKKIPVLPLTQERLHEQYPGETLSSIYDGIPYNLDPRHATEPNVSQTTVNHYKDNITPVPITLQASYHSPEVIIEEKKIVENTSKRKNYKGQNLNENAKLRIIRPQLVDTSTIVKWDNANTNIFSNPRKVGNNITIKLLPKNSTEKKRILIKDSSVSKLVQPSDDLQLSIEKAKLQVREAIHLNNKEI